MNSDVNEPIMAHSSQILYDDTQRHLVINRIKRYTCKSRSDETKTTYKDKDIFGQTNKAEIDSRYFESVL